MKRFIAFSLSGVLLSLLAWEGKVFEVRGKKITIATSQTGQVKSGTKLYVVQNGKEVGQGRVTANFHTKIEMTLSSGRAEKDYTVTDKNPGPEKPQESKATGTKWMAHKLPSKGYWGSLAYGNGTFIAASNLGSLMAVSTNGTSWIPQTLPEKMDISQIVFAKNNFVTLQQHSGEVSLSADGKKWTKYPIPGDGEYYYWSAIAHGNNTFVALASGALNGEGYGAVSTDGMSWQKTTLSGGSFWSGLVFGNSIFVALGGTSGAATSTDGITWTAQKLIVEGERPKISFGNGVFVVLPVTGSAYAISKDGAIWESMNLPVSASWGTVGFGGGLFVAFPINEPFLLISSDGIKWDKQKIPSGALWTKVVYTGKRFVAISGGENGNLILATP